MREIFMRELEKQLKGLANKRRLAIIKLLGKNKELSVASIAERIRLSFASTSKHLGILYGLDILERRQESLAVYYKLAHPLPAVVKALLPFISNSRE